MKVKEIELNKYGRWNGDSLGVYLMIIEVYDDEKYDGDFYLFRIFDIFFISQIASLLVIFFFYLFLKLEWLSYKHRIWSFNYKICKTV